MIYGVKRKDLKKMRVLLAAADIFVPDMTHLKGADSLGVRCSSEKDCAEQRKKIPYIRSETEKKEEARSSDKKGPRDGTQTHVGMSKRLDLHSKEQESTDHQAALVIGGIDLINTRIWATCKEAKHGDQREKMPEGTAATARAKGGVEGWRT
jgi:hypothetical protein